jgi:hypothetical protein
MLTIEDIRNPNRKSGFEYVSRAGGQGKGHGGGKPWCATYEADASGAKNRGPRRLTAAEAAQDYCDYINGQTAAAPAKLNFPGHTPRDTAERTAEEEEALRILRDVKAQKEGKDGYVYCIGEGDVNNPYAVKVGYSVKPEARVGELQSGNPRLLSLLAKKPGTMADEKALHNKYIKHNLVGEWFKPTDQLLSEFQIVRKATA